MADNFVIPSTLPTSRNRLIRRGRSPCGGKVSRCRQPAGIAARTRDIVRICVLRACQGVNGRCHKIARGVRQMAFFSMYVRQRASGSCVHFELIPFLFFILLFLFSDFVRNNAERWTSRPFPRRFEARACARALRIRATCVN